MPFFEDDLLRYYRFSSFLEAGITHAIFTRRGGVSTRPWYSLNVGGTVGDNPTRIRENLQRSLGAVGRTPDSLFDVWQVHGSEVVCAEAPRPKHIPHHKADAILTNKAGVTLFMRFADCVPILLFDPNRLAIGIVHAGWQGTVKRTVAAAIEVMKQRYLSMPVDILAGIGPSICRHHYEVGNDVIQKVYAVFGDDASKILSSANGKSDDHKAKLDLSTANRIVLEQAGVCEIDISNICTACNLDDWYSHRGEKGKTGRFGVLIGL
ncbi:MAG: peptidoglycan editing factor PgeF [Anaerolineales bacterium]|nr:peptidoglycan editing factor PgeF [Anaerolineales bacterium]